MLGHLFLDLDLALMDLEEFGISPGGQTELRHIAAFAATWGEDPQGWPEDWILEGPAYWWSAVDDPAYAENLQYVLGEQVSLVSSAAATAADLYRVLTEGGLLAPHDTQPEHQWLTTGDPQGFPFLARRFLGPEVEQVHQAFVGRAEERV